MTKKKLSGQTVTIIILAILLLLTCIFGGVYAYYSTTSSKISGVVKMANLKIEMRAGGTEGASGSSEILNTNSYYIPGQVLPNTALTVTNSSNTKVYLAVVYTVKAINNDESSSNFGNEITDYDLSNPLIGIHGDTTWFDGRYTNVEHDADFRYLMIPTPIAPTFGDDGKVIPKVISVIPEGKLKLHEKMGNAYQSTIITLTFRAYVIGSDQQELKDALGQTNGTNTEKCNVIMGAIFKAFDYNLN